MAAELDPRAIALDGVGFSARALALLGFFPFDTQPPGEVFIAASGLRTGMVQPTGPVRPAGRLPW